MKTDVIIICDGLRRDMVSAETTPNLVRIMSKGSWCSAHSGVFPSTTRTTAASIATGCLPRNHGLEGNAVALDLGKGLGVHSVGPPEFRDNLKRATGRTLRVPTMAERVADIGGAMNYANASPGAGIFLDPDKFGHLYHRTIAWSPGGEVAAPLNVSHDAAGDAAMTQRFIDEAILGRRPRVSLLWQCEPDHTQHDVALGSAAHQDVLRAADAQAGRVYDNVSREIETGDTLFICASDHGHETVSQVVDIEAFLIDEGLKAHSGSADVVIAPQGLSVTLYLSNEARGRANQIVDALQSHSAVGEVYANDGLSDVGLSPDGEIAIVAVGKTSDDANEHGVRGQSVAFQGDLKISNNVGCGQHGGTGVYEQSPFLICVGTGFPPGSEISEPTSAIDLAPTAMRHLDASASDMDGRALQS